MQCSWETVAAADADCFVLVEPRVCCCVLFVLGSTNWGTEAWLQTSVSSWIFPLLVIAFFQRDLSNVGLPVPIRNASLDFVASNEHTQKWWRLGRTGTCCVWIRVASIGGTRMQFCVVLAKPAWIVRTTSCIRQWAPLCPWLASVSVTIFGW